MKGRKPTPGAILSARGSHVRRNEMKAAAGSPKCPKHLKGEARREWNRIVPELMRLRVLATIDAAALGCYCAAYARWVQAEIALAENGVMVMTPNKYEVQSPWVGVSNKAMAMMHKFLTEFGLTPVARVRIAVPHQPETTRRPTANPNDPPMLRIAQ